MSCSDCVLVESCGKITNPKRTGVECPHFKKWVSKWQWLADQLAEPSSTADEDAYFEYICAREDEAHASREHMRF